MKSWGRIALVHDWLVGQRGGEQVLLRLLQVFPDADIFALVHRPGSCHERIENARITTSFVQQLPGAPARFRSYVPLFWAAVARLDVSAYDVVISSSHCVALGVHTHSSQVHIAYVHSPMRYLYDQLPEYLPHRGRTWTLPLARAALRPVRAWDKRVARRPDVLLANSRFVQRRIARVWQRPSTVVPPPVDTAYFGASHDARARRGLVCVTALTPYKRVDALVRFARQYDEPLLVIGRGPHLARLRAQAGASVQFAEGLSRAALREAYRRHEAFVFAGVEDAGIAPIEAMAAGCPVVAFEQGGVREAIGANDGELEGPGGTLFGSHEPHAIALALGRLRAGQRAGAWSAQRVQSQATRFAPETFDAQVRAEVTAARQRLLRTAARRARP